MYYAQHFIKASNHLTMKQIILCSWSYWNRHSCSNLYSDINI